MMVALVRLAITEPLVTTVLQVPLVVKVGLVGQVLLVVQVVLVQMDTLAAHLSNMNLKIQLLRRIPEMVE